MFLAMAKKLSVCLRKLFGGGIEPLQRLFDNSIESVAPPP